MDSTELSNADPQERANADSETEDGFAVTLTPLTGRDTEVSLLADRWEQAQEGMGQVVLILGESGLGKSRLVHSVKQRVLAEAGQDAGDRRGRRRSSSGDVRSAFKTRNCIPWASISRDFSTSIAKNRPRCARSAGAAPRGLRPRPAGNRRALCQTPLPASGRALSRDGLTPMREREETFRAVREWLRACSRRRPVLFVVEDLHWIDASSLEFLGQFIAEGLHDRILTVLTFRPEFRTPWPAVAHQTSLALNRLTRRQVAELMRKSAGGALPESLVAQIYERTGGVPLLVEEFIRMARDSDMFAPERAHEIPATLQQLVQAGSIAWRATVRSRNSPPRSAASFRTSCSPLW